MDGWSTTYSAESTVTKDGETIKDKVSCTINIRQVNELVSAELLEFDENHALIARRKLAKPAGDEAIDIQVSRNTAYVIIEKTVIDRYERQHKMERTVVSAPFDEEITQDRLFFKGEHGVADIRYISLRTEK